MNYYNHHIGDYAKDTGHLTMLEDGAYRRAMDRYYSIEGPLPLDRVRLHKLLRATSKAEKQAVDAVMQEFFQQTEHGWQHKRCDEEIGKAADKSAKARDAAQRSVSVRSTNAQRPLNERSADVQLPITNSQEPIANSQQPTATTQPQKGKSKETRSALVPRPEWLPPEWDRYLKLRKEKRVVISATWMEECISQLAEWHAEGVDISAVLRHSLVNGYTGIFKSDRKRNGSGGNQAVAEEWLRSQEPLEGESTRLPDA